jgi:putative two-component system response regulator
MDDHEDPANDEALEELEPVEELEELESASEEEGESPLLVSDFLRDLARSYEKRRGPFALLDRKLAFIYQNPPFRSLMRTFHYPETKFFPAIFARNLSAETTQELRDALASHDQGFSWKGSIAHKAKDCPAAITKIQVQPLWPFEDPGSAPSAYSLFLDDITEENKRSLRGTFSSLLEASKMKDNDTGKHIERVNKYADLLAHELYGDPRWPEVDVDFIDDIGFLAAMHDVGKIGTPDDILNKNGPLSEFEWSIMKEHTINGAFILSSYPNPMAKQIALSHHEWWNGSGYPYNLEGPMIPLAARIVSVADVYDALRMKRSYKPAYSHEVAMEKITQDRGLHFDPAIVDVFKRIEMGFARIYDENFDEQNENAAAPKSEATA